MKLFRSKDKQPLKAKKSPKEAAQLAERREMNAMANARFEKEKEYKQFLDKTGENVATLRRATEDAEKVAFERMQSLNEEIAKLEAKHRALETSVDEEKYRKRRQDFYKLEEEMIRRRDEFNAGLKDIEESKKSLAFIIQENEEADAELARDKEKLTTLVRLEKARIDSAYAGLKKREESIQEREGVLEVRLSDLENAQKDVEAQKQANAVFHQTLLEKEEAIKRDRTALRDAYAELEKSRNRILGRTT